MQTNLVKFHERLATDADLRGRVAEIQKQATSTFAEQISNLATEVGLPFTAEEFLAATHGTAEGLSEEQLSEVAGGVSPWETPPIPHSGRILSWGCKTPRPEETAEGR